MNRKIWLGIGFISGMMGSNFLWYLRLKQEKMLRELTLYLSEGDLSIFLGFGLIYLFMLMILVPIVIYFERKFANPKQEVTE